MGLGEVALHPVGLDAKPSNDRAYIAEMAVICQLLPDGLLGWDRQETMAAWYIQWHLSEWWATHIAPTMAIPAKLGHCGPSEVSRYTPRDHYLRIHPKDYNVVTFTHELAHAVDATENGIVFGDAHRTSWAAWHVLLLSANDPRAGDLLHTGYQHMNVL